MCVRKGVGLGLPVTAKANRGVALYIFSPVTPFPAAMKGGEQREYGVAENTFVLLLDPSHAYAF